MQSGHDRTFISKRSKTMTMTKKERAQMNATKAVLAACTKTYNDLSHGKIDYKVADQQINRAIATALKKIQSTKAKR
jgi:uncharacterized protein YecT (DUF1311 family)